MASTITPSSLVVTISEAYELNDAPYGNTITKQYVTQGKVDQRVLTIPAGEGVMTAIVGYSTADAQGQFIAADYSYFRITNLDDTNYITLQITSGDTYWIKVKPGDSFLLMDNEMDAIASSTVFGAFADITAISADADTASVDIEYLAVTA